MSEKTSAELFADAIVKLSIAVLELTNAVGEISRRVEKLEAAEREQANGG